ncbi:MAG: FAD-dependent oxidoreductase [Pseudomonadota bacterium]
MNVAVVGAGVCGLTCSAELVDRGIHVTLFEQGESIGEHACSWFAGGMLAPWCERESADPQVVTMGQMAASWWASKTQTLNQNGSLVLSPRRDLAELRQFARKTSNYQWLQGDAIGDLEADLGGRFEQALFFESESHLSPREALFDLADQIRASGSEINFVSPVDPAALAESDRFKWVIDCRGFEAADSISDLRGVKGEMLIIRSDEIALTRPVRLLHPRMPMYMVPRSDGCFMLGATMIENEDRDRITARSMLELLSAAYALHPAFGEAEIVEIGVDVRPALPNNLPAVFKDGRLIRANGLFRHGFLLSPAVAQEVADIVISEEIRTVA